MELIALNDIVSLWVIGIIIGIGIGMMVYIIGHAIGVIYNVFKKS